MKPIVELEECLRDSPKFRSLLEESEDDIEQLEQKLDKLVKLCVSMVETGKAFLNSKSLFIGGIVDLSSYFKNDLHVTSALNKLIQALNEMLKYQSILIDQAHRSICKNLNNFIKNDIRSLKETKRCFEKISDDHDQALHRNSQIPRSKPHECEDANNNLTAVRSCFHHTTLDYVQQMSVLQAKKRFEVLDTLLSFMHAKCTYFHQGYELTEDIDPVLKQMAKNLTQMKIETNDLEKQMNGCHTLVSTKDHVPLLNLNPDNGVQLEGYLFKRTSNAFKTWNRRWFIIRNNSLAYRKRTRDDCPTVMEEDLRLCTVKPATEVDRRFCFEMLSPAKSHMLQADSEETYDIWMKAMQAGINAAIHRTATEEHRCAGNLGESTGDNLMKKDLGVNSEPKKIGQTLLQQILAVPGNNECCDCKSSDPQWASINLGITLCIECSGIHRSLGVHYSKVRSLTLDAWESEVLKIMVQLGNDVINKIYEADVDPKIAISATANCNRTVREAWIKAKYIQKAFVKKNFKREPKQRLHRQRNIRKASIPRTLSSPNEEISPTLMRAEIKTSPSADPTVNKKRSGIFFPSTTDLSDSQTELYEEEMWNLKTEKESVSFEEFRDSVVDQCKNAKPVDNIQGNDTDAAEDMKNTESMELTDDDLSDIDELNIEDDANILLHRAAGEQNLPLMSEALAHGADLNWINEKEEGKTAVHQAIESGSVLACEYLFLNGAKSNVKDSLERTPLHLATQLGNTGQVCLLLKRGADQYSLDKDGMDALAVAVHKANADIVTLLRLAKLNEEMKDSDFGSSDDTFNEVVKDFSKLASDNPEKLRRIHTEEK